ncbi:MAG: hypothetical protein AAF846_08375 [Chloroflexota bacterium]
MASQRSMWLVALLLSLCFSVSQAQSSIIEVCPENPIQQRGATFEPSGIILTSFDSTALWVYDIGRNTRYPLPETSPCTSNCHLSPDAQWLIYLNPQTFVFSKMRLNGTQRTPLVSDASEVRWWNQETLLIWTTDQEVYLRPEADVSAELTPLQSDGVISMQPNGYFALQLTGTNGTFTRSLIDLNSPDAMPITLAPDRNYFNGAGWSPDGRFLAYVGEGQTDSNGFTGGELYFISPSSGEIQQATNLTDNYGAVRINGFAPSDLSWSPDSSQIAFWVIDLTGDNPAQDTGDAVLHVLDTNTQELRRYCGFTATEHTPETPRLIWSPDSSHVAFASNVSGDDKGALLLALNVETGIFTELSNGMFPVFGIPQLNAWGTVP